MVNGKTRVIVLLGSPVEHSVSPALQTAAFRALGLNAAYVPLRCQAEDIPAIMRIVTQAGGGGNVTLPHKQVAARSVSAPMPPLELTGACNTFWAASRSPHAIAGTNTDVTGVLAALDRLDAPPTSWLLLGTGGSARAVVAAAKARGAEVAIQSRSSESRKSFELWIDELGVGRCEPIEAEVVINATPLGLQPSDPLPIEPHLVPNALVALDLVYGTEGTRWSNAMASRGVRSADGREAVVAQGAAALQCWFPEVDPPVELMRAVVNARLRL